VVEKANTTPVIISWQTSNTATKYTWFLDVPSGNFSTPVVKLNADLNGANNQLTLTSGAIDAVAEAAGVVAGDSINLKWTVKAYEGTDSLFAAAPFNIKVVRAKAVGLSEKDYAQVITLYPNPVNNYLKINSGIDLNGSHYEIATLDGKQVMNGTYTGEEISLSGMQSGLYIIKITYGQSAIYKKIIKE
jgi:hypothetical protein